METGDILLFESNYTGAFGWWAWVVSFVTRSKWSHVAVILQDPTYIDESYKGIYVLESGSEQWADNWGVIVSPLERILDDKTHKRVVHRKLYNAEIPKAKLEVLYTTIINKRYVTNPIELAAIEFKSKWLANPRELDKFVCSTLVAYVYTALGLMPRITNWFFYEPCDFSETNKGLKLVNCYLGEEREIKSNMSL